MLPKQFRLSKKEFEFVRKHGRLTPGRLMGLLIVNLSNHPFIQSSIYPKAGLIVSKKLSNKAVVRNRLKRRLRAALARVLPRLPPNLHTVVLPNRRALEATVDELEQELRKLLHC